MKRFLRRFDKLEHKPFNLPNKEGFKKTKRFEYLEIGDKRIEFTIIDNVSLFEENASKNEPYLLCSNCGKYFGSAQNSCPNCKQIPEKKSEKPPAEDITYYILCPYCGKENETSQELCIHCRHDLKTQLAENYQTVAHLLKKCSSCGSMNLKERVNCWVCGKKISENVFKKETSENVLTLNIDGHIYSSNDPNLPFEIRVLMEKVRANGYDKKIIEEWIQKRNQEAELKDAFQYRNRSERLNQIRYDISLRAIGIIVFLFIFIMQFRACSIVR